VNDHEWLACEDPRPMLEFLRESPDCAVSDRQLGLYVCACWRAAWPLLTDERGRRAVEAAERYAEGLPAGPEAADAVLLLSWGAAAKAALSASVLTGGDRRPLADLLREVVGNPFRGVAVDPGWLAWNAGTPGRLAEAACEDRQLPGGILDNARLAVLADALDEAGCEDTEILGHLRQPGPHVRGCFVLDALLGRE
jgi:hypothetical protein